MICAVGVFCVIGVIMDIAATGFTANGFTATGCLVFLLPGLMLLVVLVPFFAS